MKKIIALMLAVCMCIPAFGITSFAARYTDCAKTLEELGMFKGVDVDEYSGETIYELGRGVKRAEALVMLIRFLGEEDLANMCESLHTFSDVLPGNWAYKYVAYAFEKAYTSGTSENTFSPDDEVNINSFATFLLRALGYSDKNGDFVYSSAASAAEEIGLLIKGTYGDGNAICLRDDCAYMGLRALDTKMKDSDKTLAEKLIEKGVIPEYSVEKIKETLVVADKNVTNAYINNNPVKLDGNYYTYSEFDQEGRVIKSMEHIAFYNPFAKTMSHFTYDEAGLLVREMYTDSAASPIYQENTYDSNGNIIKKTVSYIDTYSVTGDLEYDVVFYDEEPTEYFYEYDEMGRVVKVGNGNDKYNTYEYDGRTVSIKPVNYFYLEGVTVDVPFAEKFVVYDSYGDIEYTNIFTEDGRLISTYDEKNRPTYLAEYNGAGQLLKVTNYTYRWVSDSAWFDASSGSDSETVNEYIYNADGDLVKVLWYQVENGARVYEEEFTFRYFGNGKLDRILWSDEEKVTWEQTYTAFDEYGHMKAPY